MPSIQYFYWNLQLGTDGRFECFFPMPLFSQYRNICNEMNKIKKIHTILNMPWIDVLWIG